MSHNIGLLKRVAVLRNFNTLLPFFALYGFYCGLSVFEVFLLQAVFAIAVILLEVPAGVLSDCYGRKRCVCWGGFLAIVSALFYLLWTSFVGFFLAEISAASSFVLFSGSDTSLLFESSERREYLRHESRVQSYSRYSEGLSSFVGGIFYSFSIMFLPVLNVIAYGGLLWQTLMLEEANKKIPSQLTWSQLRLAWLQQWGMLIQQWRSHQTLFVRQVIIFSAFLSTVTLSLFWLLQIWFSQHHLAPYWMGVVWLAYFVSSGSASRAAKPIMERCGIRYIFYLLFFSCSLIAIVGCVASPMVMLLVFLFGAMVFGLKMPFIYYVINQVAPQDSRAGFFSLDSCLTRIMFAVVSLVIGGVVQLVSFHAAFVVLLVLNFFGLYILYFLTKNKYAKELQQLTDGLAN